MMASALCFAGSTSAVRAPAPLARRRARWPVTRRAVPVHAASRDSRLPLGVDATFDGTGKTVLITGASSGIGLEAAKQMCAAGCHVLVAARSAEKARAASEEVAAHAGALIARLKDPYEVFGNYPVRKAAMATLETLEAAGLLATEQQAELAAAR